MEEVYKESHRKESQIVQSEQESFYGDQDQELWLPEEGGWEHEGKIDLPQPWTMSNQYKAWWTIWHWLIACTDFNGREEAIMQSMMGESLLHAGGGRTGESEVSWIWAKARAI